MFFIELVGGPVDGKTYAVPELKTVIEVAVMASPKLIAEHGEEELPRSNEQYLLVNPKSDSGTKMNDLGQLVNIYRYVPQRSNNESA